MAITVLVLRQAQRLLEARLESVYATVRQFQAQVYDCQRRTALPLDDVLLRLRTICARIYDTITDTLIDLTGIVQPDDVRKVDRINFYFWPGYHSVLAKTRIFGWRREQDPAWHFGVGRCRDLRANIDTAYADSCQARLYQYLIGKRNPSAIQPGDIHEWYRHQRPRIDGILVGSFTVSADPVDRDEWRSFRDHQVLELGDVADTRRWGALLGQGINELGTVMNRGWHFPARQDRKDAERLQSLMASVWLHAAFRSSAPPWLDAFIGELSARPDATVAATALRSAVQDPIASDWADRSSGRPAFTCWSNLALRPSLAPAMLPALFPMRPPLERETAAADPESTESVGSAAFLSSVTPGPAMLSLARPWLSAVYDMVRDAEVAILLNNHQIEAARTVGMSVGPWYAHELRRITDDGIHTLVQEASFSGQKALETRVFVLNSVRTLGDLAYGYASGMVSPEGEPFRQQRDEFDKALSSLREKGHLANALHYVARQVYRMTRRGDGGRLKFAGPCPDRFDLKLLTADEHRICLLIVAEAVRSYCEAETWHCTARWQQVWTEDGFEVTLEGPSRSQRNPASVGFGRLDTLLRALGIGQAVATWESKEHFCSYVVKLRLPHSAPTDRPKQTIADGDATRRVASPPRPIPRRRHRASSVSVRVSLLPEASIAAWR
jgi:hypothetical protein